MISEKLRFSFKEIPVNAKMSVFDLSETTCISTYSLCGRLWTGTHKKEDITTVDIICRMSLKGIQLGVHGSSGADSSEVLLGGVRPQDGVGYESQILEKPTRNIQYPTASMQPHRLSFKVIPPQAGFPRAPTAMRRPSQFPAHDSIVRESEVDVDC